MRENTQVSHKKAITQRLGVLKALFLLGGYKQLKIDFQRPEPLPVARSEEEDINVAMQMTQASSADVKEALEIKEPEPTASEKVPEPEELDDEDNYFPQVEWTSEDRSPQLAGKAAEYIELTNVVLANRDFKGFADIVQYFTEKYAGTTGVDAMIVSGANEAIEQALMECVAGALSLRGQPNWTVQQVNIALSPEALTTAAMQRYWMISYVDQIIRKHLLEARSK
jgi:hypothetical protein